MSNEITGVLEDWWYDELNHVIWGYIYGDNRRRFRDGTYIHTSSLNIPKSRMQNEDFINSLHQIQTRNSVYRLGEPHKAKSMDI